MDFDLVGYLIGALDEDERAAITRRLKHDPALRRQLEQLRANMRPLADADDCFEPAGDLVERTWGTVAASDKQYGSLGPVSLLGLRMSDTVVVVGVFLVAAVLFFPAILHSRYQARILTCQHNLQELGKNLIAFSERQPDRRFPQIAPKGNRAFAGMVATTLADNLFIDRRCSWLVCPSSELADDVRGWSVASVREIDRASDMALVYIQRHNGGSTAFNLGVVEDGKYMAPRNEGRSYFALLGDSPSLHLQGRISANHAGRGQNLLYEDGRVRIVRGGVELAFADDPFRNIPGYLEAGMGRNDSVVAPSGMPPFLPAVADRFAIQE